MKELRVFEIAKAQLDRRAIAIAFLAVGMTDDEGALKQLHHLIILVVDLQAMVCKC
jgi:hypothetical protein